MKKWHLGGYEYIRDKEEKDYLKWHTGCFDSQDFQAMGSGLVTAINSFPFQNAQTCDKYQNPFRSKKPQRTPPSTLIQV